MANQRETQGCTASPNRPSPSLVSWRPSMVLPPNPKESDDWLLITGRFGASCLIPSSHIHTCKDLSNRNSLLDKRFIETAAFLIVLLGTLLNTLSRYSSHESRPFSAASFNALPTSWSPSMISSEYPSLSGV
jgi:hypothetical protein